MTLIPPRTQLVASLLLAGTGLWLFFGDGIELAGASFGILGVWLFVAATWFFVDAVHRVPRSEAEQALSPAEWEAWIGVVFLGAVLVAMAQAADVFAAHVPIHRNPEAGEAGRHVGALFIAWLLLSWVLRQRWKGAVLEDERDRRVALVACQWGRGATVVLVVGIALLLGFSPVERLVAFSPAYGAHLLMCALVAGALAEHAVLALLHWRDRRGMGG